MKRIRAALAVLTLSLAGVATASPASALPTLPPGAGDIVPEINWAQFMSPIVQASAINCTVNTVTGTSAVTVGQKFAPMTNPMTDGLLLMTLMKTPTADVTSDCTSEVTIPTTPIDVTGTFTAPQMASVQGVGGAGNIALKCVATTPTPTVTFTVVAKFGGAVNGKAQINGKSSTADVAFKCNMSLAFGGGAGLTGTVDGKLKISDSSNPVCATVTMASCVQISMAEATVSVIGGSGALADASGSGTYSLSDYLSLNSIDSAINQVKSMSVSASALASNGDQLKLALLAGKHKVTLVSPVQSGRSVSYGKGAKFEVLSAPSASCKVTATLRGKTVTIGSSKLSAAGTGSYTVSAAVAKKLLAAGVKKNTKPATKVACTVGKSTTTLSLAGKYTG